MGDNGLNRNLLLLEVFRPPDDPQDLEDRTTTEIFRRVTQQNTTFYQNRLISNAITEEIRYRRTAVSWNLLCQFLIDMIRDDMIDGPSSTQHGTRELRPYYYSILYSFAQDLLRRSHDERIRNQLPRCMLDQVNRYLLQYEIQLRNTREMFASEYLDSDYLEVIRKDQAHRVLPFPNLIWLNSAYDTDVSIDTPQSCLRRAYFHQRLKVFGWDLKGFQKWKDVFQDQSKLRKMVEQDNYFRDLILSEVLNVGHNNAEVTTLGGLLNYLSANELDRRTQIRVSPLKKPDDYRFEILLLFELSD